MMLVIMAETDTGSWLGAWAAGLIVMILAYWAVLEFLGVHLTRWSLRLLGAIGVVVASSLYVGMHDWDLNAGWLGLQAWRGLGGLHSRWLSALISNTLLFTSLLSLLVATQWLPLRWMAAAVVPAPAADERRRRRERPAPPRQRPVVVEDEDVMAAAAVLAGPAVAEPEAGDAALPAWSATAVEEEEAWTAVEEEPADAPDTGWEDETGPEAAFADEAPEAEEEVDEEAAPSQELPEPLPVPEEPVTAIGDEVAAEMANEIANEIADEVADEVADEIADDIGIEEESDDEIDAAAEEEPEDADEEEAPPADDPWAEFRRPLAEEQAEADEDAGWEPDTTTAAGPAPEMEPDEVELADDPGLGFGPDEDTEADVESFAAWEDEADEEEAPEPEDDGPALLVVEPEEESAEAPYSGPDEAVDAALDGDGPWEADSPERLGVRDGADEEGSPPAEPFADSLNGEAEARNVEEMQGSQVEVLEEDVLFGLDVAAPPVAAPEESAVLGDDDEEEDWDDEDDDEEEDDEDWDDDDDDEWEDDEDEDEDEDEDDEEEDWEDDEDEDEEEDDDEGEEETGEDEDDEEEWEEDDDEDLASEDFQAAAPVPADALAVTDVLSQVPEEDHALFTLAVGAILEADRVSLSRLQRDLGVTYYQAARVFEQLEHTRLISPYDGNLSRAVLLPRAPWQEWLGRQT